MSEYWYEEPVPPVKFDPCVDATNEGVENVPDWVVCDVPEKYKSAAYPVADDVRLTVAPDTAAVTGDPDCVLK